MSHIKSEKLLDVAVEASLAASTLSWRLSKKPKTSNHKGTTDLVTATDLESEKIIKAIIKASFSDHSVLAEETGKETSESNYLWVIDPLDGTTNFVHGYPSFGVSIGVYFNREPIASAIIEMPTLKLYTAIKGKGAFCEGKEIHASKNLKAFKILLWLQGLAMNMVKIGKKIWVSLDTSLILLRELGD